jgi:hypothetical protein
LEVRIGSLRSGLHPAEPTVGAKNLPFGFGYLVASDRVAAKSEAGNGKFDLAIEKRLYCSFKTSPEIASPSWRQLMKPVVSLILFSLFASQCKAETLVGTVADLAQQGLSFQQNQYLAQEFTLNASAQLTSVSLTFFDNDGPSFGALFQIVDQLGPGTTNANVLFSAAVTMPAGLNPAVLEISVANALTPGVYYLLLSTDELLPLQTRLANGGDVVAGTPGLPGSAYFSVSQNTAFPAASPFVPVGGFPTPFAAFTVEGTIPEPKSLHILGVLALAALVMPSKRRMNARPSRCLRRPQVRERDGRRIATPID